MHEKMIIIRKIRVVALLTAFIFGASSVGIAPFSFSDSFVPSPALPAEPAKFPVPPFLTLPSIQLSPELGKVEEIFYPQVPSPGPGKKAPFIYLIQDAHDSLDAQENIRRILRQLVEKERVSLVLFEGGSLELDRSFYDFTSDAKLNERVWETLFEQGEMGAVERSALEAPGTIRFYGIEDEKVYFENVRMIQRVYAREEESRTAIQEIEAVLEEQRRRLLTGELKKLRKARQDLDEKRIDLKQYVNELSRWAKRILNLNLSDPVRQDDWPQLVRLLKLSEFEARLKTIGPVNFPYVKGHLRWYFEREVDEGKLDFEKDSHLKDWIGFHVLQDELDARALFAELDRLEKQILDRMPLRDETRKFLVMESDWELAKKLMRLELTRREWEQVRSSDFSRFRIATKVATTNYRLVELRDRILAKRTLEKIQEIPAEKAALVIGGFHTLEMTSFLKRNRIGHAVIAPQIKNLNRRLNYRARMNPGPGPGGETSSTRALARQTGLAVAGALGTPEAELFKRGLEQAARRALSSSLGQIWKTGDTLGKGRFEIVGVVGKGGQAMIFLAKDLRRANQLVILKRLENDPKDSKGTLRKEARVMMSLHPHDHIPQVYEYYEEEGADEALLVSELLEGVNFVQWQKDEAPTLEQEIEKLIPIADALAHAHRKHIVHLDVKRENIIIRDKDGRPYLTDFGLAGKTGALSQVEMSQTFMTALDQAARGGTLPYIAPERFRGEEPEAAADIWSFGVMLYLLAAGSYPFAEKRSTDGKLIKEIKEAILEDEPERPSVAALRNGKLPIPVDLENLILKMLIKDPVARVEQVKTMKEVKQALQAIRWAGPFADGSASQTATVVPVQTGKGAKASLRESFASLIEADGFQAAPAKPTFRTSLWERAQMRLGPRAWISEDRKSAWMERALARAEELASGVATYDSRTAVGASLVEEALANVRFAMQIDPRLPDESRYDPLDSRIEHVMDWMLMSPTRKGIPVERSQELLDFYIQQIVRHPQVRPVTRCGWFLRAAEILAIDLGKPHDALRVLHEMFTLSDLYHVLVSRLQERDRVLEILSRVNAHEDMRGEGLVMKGRILADWAYSDSSRNDAAADERFVDAIEAFGTALRSRKYVVDQRGPRLERLRTRALALEKAGKLGAEISPDFRHGMMEELESDLGYLSGADLEDTQKIEFLRSRAKIRHLVGGSDGEADASVLSDMSAVIQLERGKHWKSFLERAEIFFSRKELDSARADMRRALARCKTKKEKAVVFLRGSVAQAKAGLEDEAIQSMSELNALVPVKTAARNVMQNFYHRSESVRRVAAIVSGRMGEPLIQTLVAKLESESAEEREAAVIALGNTTVPRMAMEELLGKLESPNVTVRDAAFRVLGEIGGSAVYPLIEMSKDHREGVQVSSIRVLGDAALKVRERSEINDVIGALIKATQGKQPADVKMEAVLALIKLAKVKAFGKIPGRDVIAVILSTGLDPVTLLYWDSSSVRLENALAELLRQEDEEMIQWVKEIMRDLSPEKYQFQLWEKLRSMAGLELPELKKAEDPPAEVDNGAQRESPELAPAPEPPAVEAAAAPETETDRSDSGASPGNGNEARDRTQKDLAEQRKAQELERLRQIKASRTRSPLDDVRRKLGKEMGPPREAGKGDVSRQLSAIRSAETALRRLEQKRLLADITPKNQPPAPGPEQDDIEEIEELEGYGNSLGAILLISDALGQIGSLDIKNYFPPKVYKRLLIHLTRRLPKSSRMRQVHLKRQSLMKARLDQARLQHQAAELITSMA